MAKYLCGTLILILISCSNSKIGHLDLKVVDVNNKELLELVDSLIKIERHCDYYNENGYFLVSFRDDSLMEFSYFETIKVFPNFRLNHRVFLSNDNLILLSYESNIPYFIKEKEETMNINVYFLDSIKPEIVSFGTNYSERYYKYEADTFEIKYEVNLCN